MSDKVSPKPGIEEYAEWLGRVLRRAFFPLEEREESLEPPTAVPRWYETLPDEDKAMAAQMFHIYQEMITAADEIVQEGNVLTVQQYDAVVDNFDQFMTHLDRFETGGGNQKAGGRIDSITGMRSEVGMYDDLMRELERRSRKGTPFAVGCCAIDDFMAFSTEHSEADTNAIINYLAQTLKTTLRTFDDIYHVGKGEFVVCLKDTEVIDAYVVTDRICEKIRDSSVSLPSGDEGSMTVSFGVAEPMPGDEGTDITNSARNALKDAQELGGNRAVQYEEVSPLMKFAQESKDP